MGKNIAKFIELNSIYFTTILKGLEDVVNILKIKLLNNVNMYLKQKKPLFIKWLFKLIETI